MSGAFLHPFSRPTRERFITLTRGDGARVWDSDGKEYVGKDVVIHKSELFQGSNDILSQDLRGPFFLGDRNASSGRFAVYTSIDFAPKAGGDRVTHEEVGLYTVKNDTITREEFFYYDMPFA